MPGGIVGLETGGLKRVGLEVYLLEKGSEGATTCLLLRLSLSDFIS